VNQAPVAKAYLLLGCPFCFKFLLFMTEAGLLDQIEVVALDHGSPEYGALKAELEQRAGRALSFPAVETEPGVIKTDTQALIAHFRASNGLDDASLPVLDFYQKGLFQNVVNLYQENMALKARLKES
jgi:hypothetical protein